MLCAALRNFVVSSITNLCVSNTSSSNICRAETASWNVYKSWDSSPSWISKIFTMLVSIYWCISWFTNFYEIYSNEVIQQKQFIHLVLIKRSEAIVESKSACPRRFRAVAEEPYAEEAVRPQFSAVVTFSSFSRSHCLTTSFLGVSILQSRLRWLRNWIAKPLETSLRHFYYDNAPHGDFFEDL